MGEPQIRLQSKGLWWPDRHTGTEIWEKMNEWPDTVQGTKEKQIYRNNKYNQMT